MVAPQDTQNRPPQSPENSKPPVFDTSSKPFPEVEFLPFADEKEEKKRFWKTVILTVLICSAVSLIVLGVIFSQRVQSPTSNNISTNYILTNESPTPRLVSAENVQTPTTGILRIPINTTSQGPALSPIQVGAGKKVTITQALTPLPTTPSQTTSLTPTQTITPTLSASAPTPYLYASTDGSSGVVFSYTLAGSSTSSVVQIVNIGGSALTITDLSFSTTGSTNPYVLSGGGNAGCLISSSLPYELKVGATACISIHYNPTAQTTTTNSLVIRWNTSNIKSVPIAVATPTPTPTNTPTPTP